MTLEHELSTLPHHALIILQYMAQNPDRAADADMIQAATSLSDRALGKAIKRLTTRRFLAMDNDRFYSLSAKGHQALELMSRVDFASGVEDDVDAINYDLCAVVPSQLASGQLTQWMIGISPAEGEVPEHPTDIYLRIDATNGAVTPSQTTLSISVQQSMSSATLNIQPTATQGTMRIRVEAYQFFELDEPADAGGMYFDIPIGTLQADLKAYHSTISLT